VAHTSRLLRCVRCKMGGCQHSMTIMASASRAVQEPAALAVPVIGPAPAGRSLIAHMPNSGMYAPPARTEKKGAFLCASVSLWLMQSIFSQLRQPWVQKALWFAGAPAGRKKRFRRGNSPQFCRSFRGLTGACLSAQTSTLSFSLHQNSDFQARAPRRPLLHNSSRE
jgi:hypothetical protein